ncbi:MAG: site-specific DNA-methyltransferase [Pirellulales bacterium]|nr:site-specific DNA-methyltransferase [Pirellulales bacterium]
MLRFDPTGQADRLPELLETARQRKLTEDEVRLLAEALQKHEPWLEWAGKREAERTGFGVDPVALHIHERVSPQAILRVAARQDVERSLFADPEQEYHEAVQFYRHDIDWTNRLILGDSLQVMSSLAHREDLKGKVQMIYIDPPYGIKFASNFQPEVGRRDVKDKETDLTREPEMVKAYRDTWHLGVHSYLSYLRDRLIVARELLADTASIFVQISTENLHLVRQLLDEVFGAQNFAAQLSFRTKIPLRTTFIAATHDFLLWYAKNKERMIYRKVFVDKGLGDEGRFSLIELPSGERRYMNRDEKASEKRLPDGAIPFVAENFNSAGRTESCVFPFEYCGRTFKPTRGKSWKTNLEGMTRLRPAERLFPSDSNLYYVLLHQDYPVQELHSVWNDTRGDMDKTYVVQTSTKVIERCLLMTTDPGDLVLDPTCGSGTTAYVAEQWGRRWITIDTSRVAIAIARQRLLTARFERYRIKGEDPAGNGNNNHRPGVDPHPGFVYKTVPHITLKSIAQNQNLDPIFAKHEPILAAKVQACNAALPRVSKELRQKLELKLRDKERNEGKWAVTDADRRRWLLPPDNRGTNAERHKKQRDYTVDLEFAGWYDWEIPFDTDPDWPKNLQTAVTEYRKAWRAKMDEVNACIAANAEQEELVDQPEVVRGVVRVSGPFTVEAVQPPEISLSDVVATLSPIGGEPADMETFAPARTVRYVEAHNELEVQNVEAYLDHMTKLLKLDGVRFPNNKEMAFSRLERIRDASGIHAEGRWVPKSPGRESGETAADPDPEGVATVGVVFGPQYGPFTMAMLEKVIKPAGRRYDDLVIAGFSFAPEVYDLASNPEHQRLKIHVAHIRPDVNPGMNGLLKEQPNSQLFTVFGLPRSKVEKVRGSDDYVVTMEGVDIYDPVTNTIASTGAEKVAAWFIDGDYDGRTFCITQAFFPDRSAWDKLARALGSKNGVISEEAFEKMSGTVSLPFPAGKHRCVAVKVIDPRGNEVMQVHRLE